MHHKDVTGKEIERALLAEVAKQNNIEMLQHYFVVDIVTQHHLGFLVTKSTPNVECYGMHAQNLQTINRKKNHVCLKTNFMEIKKYIYQTIIEGKCTPH